MPQTSLTEQDYARAADALNAPLSAVKAVASVESGGSGFLPDGRVKVQYEPHVMYQRLMKRFGTARANTELAKYPDLVAKTPGSYQSADKEDRDMDRASNCIDRACALESASWGMFQIMGYHWKTLGYQDLQAFVNAMYSAAGQLDAFVRFILADDALLRAIRRKDWKTFAYRYNGPGYAKNDYDNKMAAADKRFGGA